MCGRSVGGNHPIVQHLYAGSSAAYARQADTRETPCKNASQKAETSAEASRHEDAAFTFVDLFAGIGGFHAALGALGGECVYAVEKDPRRLPSTSATGGCRPSATSSRTPRTRWRVPPHDVLAAGFPCQPFSKSGFQRGMDEARGTLFWNICRDPRGAPAQRWSCWRTCATSPGPATRTSGTSSSGRCATSATGCRRSRSCSRRTCSRPSAAGDRRCASGSSSSAPTWVSRAHARRRRPAVAACAGRRLGPRRTGTSRSTCRSSPTTSSRTALRLRLTPAETTGSRPGTTSSSRCASAAWTSFPGFPVWVDAFVHEET